MAIQYWLWFIPVLLLFSYLQKRTSLQKPAWALLIVCLLLYWNYSSLNNRFGTLTYDKDTVTLVMKSGQSVSLDPQQIERFRSVITGPRTNTAAYCFLLIVGKDENYQSLTVDSYSHSCLKDAEKLNLFYRKVIPQL